MKSYYLFFAAALIFQNTAQAQKRIYVNEYLNIGVGAQGLGMAGAQSAGADDVYGTFYNPAGLSRIDNSFQAAFMHAAYFAGNAKYDFGAAAMPLKNSKGTVGLSLIRYATDDIAYTIDYVQPDGSFDESKLKSISAGDYAFVLSYARPVPFLTKDSGRLETHIGVNAKVIYRHIGGMANAWGAGVDIGLQSRYKRWYFGLMMKDISTTYTAWSFHLTEREKEIFGQTGNEIPVKSSEVMLPRFNIGIGRLITAAGRPFSLYAEAGLDLTTDGKRNTLLAGNTISLDPRLGLQAGYKNTVFLRLGVGNFQQVLDDADSTNQKKIWLYQPAVGVGLRLLQRLQIDYAYTSLQTQQNPLYSHVISLRLSFDRLDREAVKDAKPRNVNFKKRTNL